MTSIVSGNFTTHPRVMEGLLNDNQYLLASGIESLLRGIVSILGLMGNMMNIVTYISMRPNDVVTISFLVLACSEFSYLITMVSCAVSFGFYLIEKIYNMTIWFPVEPYGVYIFFSNVGNIPYTFSVLLTTLLALARCLSVWRPLQFKNIVRPKRFIYILTVFVLFSIGGYIPVLVYMGMIDQFNVKINASRPSLWISPKREQIKVGLWAARDALLPTATQIVVTACVIVMAHSLKKTSSFRQSHFPKTITETKTKPENSETHTKLTGKELNAIKQVLSLSLVFIACNLPKVIVSFMAFFLPDLALGQLNQNMYLFLVGFIFLLQVINSSSSFLIYYTYSTKFRKHFALCFKSK